MSSPSSVLTRIALSVVCVRTELGTGPPYSCARGCHSVPPPLSWPPRDVPSLGSAAPELGAGRPGCGLPPPCIKLGRGALRAGPHQGLVAFSLALKRSAVTCHSGPSCTLHQTPSLKSSLKLTKETNNNNSNNNDNNINNSGCLEGSWC